MNTWFCKGMYSKATLAAAVASLAFIATSPAQAGCSNGSLKGKYGQTISGQILPAPGVVLPQNGIAMTTFDGKGTFTQEDFVVINGAPTSTGFETGETGTYTINSDCTGTAVINYPNGSWIDLELVIVHQGREFRTVVSSLNNLGVLQPANIGSSGCASTTPMETSRHFPNFDPAMTR